MYILVKILFPRKATNMFISTFHLFVFSFL